jgi:alpha-beta hydrolase superfamily lysophospholipase
MRLATSRVSLRRLVLSASVLVQQSRPFSFAWNTYTAMPSTHITERDGSGTITVSPRNEATQSGLVVICHGLGDTAEGFEDVAEVSTNIIYILYV